MKDPDLLRDALEDAIPPGLAEASLHALTRAARQRRLRSRAAAIAVPVLALAAGIIFLPRPASAPPAARSIAVHASPPIAPPSVEYLTDEQLLSLFAPELGVVLAGPPEDRRLLVVARNPQSDTP
jgi:hypothetical protein